MTTDGPRKAAFETTEILEAILELLPPKQILAMQRVNKQFQAVIKTSPSIQHKLFIRLKVEPEQKWALRMIQGQHLLLDCYFDTANPIEAQSTKTVVPVAVNPLFRIASYFRHLPSAERSRMGADGERLTFDCEKPLKIEQLLNFGRVHFSDPPCAMFEVIFEFTIATKPRTRFGFDRTIRSDIPLTADAVISTALAQTGPVYTYQGSTSTRRYQPLDAVPSDMIKGYEDETGLKARLTVNSFYLRGCIAPSDGERAEVKSRQKAKEDAAASDRQIS